MFSIADLAGGVSGTVELRGKRVPIHGLSVAESRWAWSLERRPEVPWMANPGKGSQAEPVPNEVDSNYQRQVSVYGERSRAVEAAMALRWETADGLKFEPAERGKMGAWAAKAREEVMEHLSDGEVLRVRKAVEGLYDKASLENAVKNSSGPGAEAAPAGTA